MKLIQGKILHVSRDGRDAVSCTCIGEPYSARIVAESELLPKAVLAYLSEYDNPVPDAVYRAGLRDHLRTLVGAPPAPRRAR